MGFYDLINFASEDDSLIFQSCDLVIRFDPLQHLVGYVQSRGRARNKASTFVIMIQKDDIAHLTRYKALQEGEPELNKAYQARHNESSSVADDDEDNDDETDLIDLAERERYVVPSTGAVLTYDNAIGLLNHLCALIPRDAFTPAHIPRWSGDFQATLHLPSGLPLDAEYLTFCGPPRHSKREAKRAAAFMGVRTLHKLDVFDQYLLPAASPHGKGNEDLEGRLIMDVSRVPNVMSVAVRDPWVMGPRLWIHPVSVAGCVAGGLVASTLLPPVEVICDGLVVRLGDGRLLEFNEDEEVEQRRVMQEYTKLGIWYRITSSPVTQLNSLFLVPLTVDKHPDFGAIGKLLEEPHGSYDWSCIREDDNDHLLVMNDNEFGRVLLLRRIRHDLTALSMPIPGSREDAFATYRDFFTSKWDRKNRKAHVPITCPLIEVYHLTRSFSASYSLRSNTAAHSPAHVVTNGMLVPQGCCRWINLSPDMSRAFDVLPILCHRITDVYRIHHSRLDLGLPAITEDLLVEAYTLPPAAAGYSNQRMETLGDGVLQLCTTVYLFNKYPHRHEGQLSIMRQNVVSNRYLLAVAKEIGLERFLSCEIQSVYKWRYVTSVDALDALDLPRPRRSVPRNYPRRNLQDCVEASLGAAFLTGGIPMALHAGAALNMAFGGTQAWSLRYGRNPRAKPAPSLFSDLEDRLGYTFHNSNLLLEAVTHPSFATSSDGPSYQRLEFLGDGND